jgi:alcohol dehydrogenase class IV
VKNIIFSKKKILIFLKKIKKKNVLIISGKQSFNKSGLKNIFFRFLKNKSWKMYFKYSKVPEIDEIKKITQIIRKQKPNLIIAAGGGAVIDLAKISNNFYKYKNLKNKILRPNSKISQNYCKLYAIPTTAGSGAEATSNAVVYINKKKYSVENKNIAPNFQILCPELVIKNSHSLKMSSGFDAIAQAVESLMSIKSNKKSINYAIKSLEYSLSSYLKYLSNPNSSNSKNMLLAANFSGKAINISKTTAPHAISYPFTAHFGISHGHAVALTFSEFLEYNFLNSTKTIQGFPLNERLKILLKLTKSQNLNDLLKFFKLLKTKAKIESNLKKLNINIDRDINKILKGINFLRLSNNPVKVNIEDVKKILLKKNHYQ